MGKYTAYDRGCIPDVKDARWYLGGSRMEFVPMVPYLDHDHWQSMRRTGKLN